MFANWKRLSVPELHKCEKFRNPIAKPPKMVYYILDNLYVSGGFHEYSNGDR